jgi:putative glycosyltransferase (TIGR04372 family)|tara:strand:- start:3116 stop:4345 length:1230 start_codon:yes stop_codon:yes gene_type:complete
MFRNFLYFIFLKIIIFLNSFIKIRFQELQTKNIGHYSKSIEVYLSEVDCGLQISYKFDFWIKNKSVANKFLLKKLREKINILPSAFFWGFLKYIKENNYRKLLIPYKHPDLYEKKEWHLVNRNIFKNLDQWHFYDGNKVLNKTQSKIKLTEKENIEFQSVLNLVQKNELYDKIVLFYARDKMYRTLQHGKEDIMNWRNTDVNSYLKAMNLMAEKKYLVIRMGKVMQNKLTADNPLIMDYPFSNIRRDSMDMYLCSTCKFGIFDSGGFNAVPCLFRKPLGLVNISHLREIKNRNDGTTPLIIFKKIFSEKLGRVLSFSEYEKYEVYKNILDEDFKRNELKVIDNSAEDIYLFTKEAEKKFNNLKKEEYLTKDEIDLQKQAKKILKDLNYGDLNFIDIGHKFLSNNKNLLQ